MPVPDAAGVVVGVDGSEAALRAVCWAAAEARVRGLPLQILHAAPYAGGPMADAGRGRSREVLAAALTAARRGEPDVPISTRSDLEPPVPALRAAAGRARLLVLGGGDRLQAEPTESVGLRVVEEARCPVVVVRGRLRTAADERPVVVGLDGSELDALVLATGFAEARRHGCPLVVVHSTWAGGTVGDVSAPARSRGVVVTLRMLATHPTTALLDAARGSRLLVIGNRGRSAPVRVLLGSTCRDLLRRSPVPVEVVSAAVSTQGVLDGLPAFDIATTGAHDHAQLW